MNRIFYNLFLSLFLLTFMSCSEDDTKEYNTSPQNPTQKTVLVTKVKLSETSVNMSVGETRSINAEVSPSDATNKDVTWSSSNTNVATVSSSGVVTAKAAGSATITAKANDGSNVTASCTVTVTPKTVSVTKVTLSKTTAEMLVGETLTLTATVSPSDATNKSVTWSSSNTSVASVDNNGRVTAKSVGEATITVKADGGDNVKDQCKIVVKKGDSIGINDYDSDKNWN